MKINLPITRWLALAALLSLNLQPATVHAQSGVWATNLATVIPRAQGAAATVGGMMYMVGGGNYSCGVYATLQAYDPVSNVWNNLAPMPTARYEVGVTELNGLLYAIGGNPGCGSSGLGAVECYNPGSNSWSTLAPLPTGLAQPGVVSANGKIYAIGGWSHNGIVVYSVYCYDPVADSWSLKTPIPVEFVSGGGAAVAVNGIIYVIGTISAGGQWQGVYAYDPVADAWTAKTSMPTARSGYAAAAVNGIIYVAGGYSSSGTSATVEAYNPATDSWSTVTPLPFPLDTPSAAAINDTLYIMGGYNVSFSTVGSVEAFTPPPLTVNMYAGLTIYGQIGNTYEIDYCNDLSTSNWTALTTMVLSNSPCLYIDTNSTYFSQRYYRRVIQP